MFDHARQLATPLNGKLAGWRRWQTADWRTAGLLALLIVLQCAGAVLLPLGESPDDWFWGTLSLAALGAMAVPPALLAWWAVFGPQRIAVRLPLTLWLLGVYWLCGAAGAAFTSVDMDATASFVMGGAWLLSFLVMQLPLWLLRAGRRWRLEQIGVTDPCATSRASQFTLGGLLCGTFAAASLLGAWRWLFGAGDVDVEIVTESLQTEIAYSLMIVLTGLPSLALAWILLASGKRPVLRSVLSALILACVACSLVIFHWHFDGEMEQVIGGALIESGAILSGLVSVATIWACGYRLNRHSKKPAAANVVFRSAKELSFAERKTTFDEPPQTAIAARAPVNGRRFAVALVALLAIACGMAWSVPHRREMWRQAAIRDDWDQCYVNVSFDDAGKLTGTGYARALPIPDETLRRIAELGDLESLHLAHSGIDDRQLALLAPLAGRLRELTLRETNIADAGLKVLSRFRGLESLDLANTHVTDAGIALLKDLGKLRVLRLQVTDVTDATIAVLARLPSLRELDVKLTAVSASGAEAFRQKRPDVRFRSGASHGELSAWLSPQFVYSTGAGGRQPPPRTTRLHLRGRNITDAAITLLCAVPELEDLDLRDSAVTDAGVTALSKLPALRRLDLRGSAVTDGGVARLAAALPNCEIVR